VVWTWHAPVLHHAAREGATVLILEQGTFLAAGLLLIGGLRLTASVLRELVPGDRAHEAAVSLENPLGKH
jgi:hypothetical protein